MTIVAEENQVQTATRLAVGLSVLSLLIGGWSMVVSLDDAADRGQVERRLSCLELPGPNDCGPDR